MRFEEGKYYRTRDGSKVKCIAVSTQDHKEEYGALCKVAGCKIASAYTIDGCFNAGHVDDWDIVAEWKETKKVKMAPYIFRSGEGSIMVSGRMFDSEESARAHCNDLFSYQEYFKCEFLRWLGGTPYEVEIDETTDERD